MSDTNDTSEVQTPVQPKSAAQAVAEQLRKSTRAERNTARATLGVAGAAGGFVMGAAVGHLVAMTVAAAVPGGGAAYDMIVGGCGGMGALGLSAAGMVFGGEVAEQAAIEREREGNWVARKIAVKSLDG